MSHSQVLDAYDFFRCRGLRQGPLRVHGEHRRRHGQADDDGQQEQEHRSHSDERPQLEEPRNL